MIKNNKINLNKKTIVIHKKGFTFIEILLIVAIIGILAVVIMVIGSQSGKDRAAISSYKTTMNSVKTAVELCGEGNINDVAGGLGEGSNVCASGFSNVKYPEMDNRCGVESFTFIVGEENGKWAVATEEECRGCKIGCSVEGCQAIDGTADKCK